MFLRYVLLLRYTLFIGLLLRSVFFTRRGGRSCTHSRPGLAGLRGRWPCDLDVRPVPEGLLPNRVVAVVVLTVAGNLTATRARWSGEFVSGDRLLINRKGASRLKLFVHTRKRLPYYTRQEPRLARREQRCTISTMVIAGEDERYRKGGDHPCFQRLMYSNKNMSEFVQHTHSLAPTNDIFLSRLHALSIGRPMAEML